MTVAALDERSARAGAELAAARTATWGPDERCAPTGTRRASSHPGCPQRKAGVSMRRPHFLSRAKRSLLGLANLAFKSGIGRIGEISTWSARAGEGSALGPEPDQRVLQVVVRALPNLWGNPPLGMNGRGLCKLFW